MIDSDRVARLLNDIEESLEIISDIVGAGVDEFLADARSRYALR